MKPTYYIMVGIPGSGKSTYALTLGERIFSSDMYRELLTGDTNNQLSNDAVFKLLHKDIRECLSSGKSCILDATNVSRKDRRKSLEAAKGLDCITCAVVICPPYEVCLERNRGRSRIVPDEVMDKMVRRFEFPQKFEGFDNIIVHNGWNESSNETLQKLELLMIGFNQHNPHHKYTLSEHCQRVANQFDINTVEYTAGFFHDIGKLVTKRFDDQGVAHYYNHDSIGTYIVASHLCFNSYDTEVQDNQLYMLFLINYHMRAHNDFMTPKAERKYRKLFGNEWYDKLIQFGEADRIATGTYEGRKDVRPGLN